VDRAGLRRKLLKAQAEAGDIVLLFGDESEALTHPYLAHVWAKKGADLRVPAPGQAAKGADLRVPAPGQAAKGAMLGVLDWARRELIVHTSRTKRSSDFIALLEEIDRRYGPKLGGAIQPLVLVLDNAPIHTSKAARGALAARAHWLTVEWLPKYAPELNDIEGLWRDLKRHHLAHQTFAGPDDLDQAIHDAVRKLNTERSRHPLANHRIAA
jgi:transposase